MGIFGFMSWNHVAFCQGLAFYLCVSALMMKRWKQISQNLLRLQSWRSILALRARGVFLTDPVKPSLWQRLVTMYNFLLNSKNFCLFEVSCVTFWQWHLSVLTISRLTVNMFLCLMGWDVWRKPCPQSDHNILMIYIFSTMLLRSSLVSNPSQPQKYESMNINAKMWCQLTNFHCFDLLMHMRGSIKFVFTICKVYS